MNNLFPLMLSKLDRGAIRIAGVYLLLGGLWILFSDQLAARVASNPEMLALISLYKGWGYVIVTALLLYWLVQRHTATLLANEAQLHRVLNAMPAFISYVGADRRYQFTNKTYEEWFDGKTEGKHIQDVWGRAAYGVVAKFVDKALNGETVNHEVEMPVRGQDRFFHIRYIPDIEVSGRVKGFFVLASDRTELRRAEEERRLWGKAFEGCAHGIAIGDPHSNRILVCNPAFASLHKSRVEDVIGVPLLSLYAQADHEAVRGNIQKADQIGHSRFEALMIRRDGSTFPVQMDLVSVLGEDGELEYRVATAQDITEYKQAEAQILYQSRLLEQVNDAVIASDERFVITSWNPAAEHIYGWEAEEVIGKSAEQILKTDFPNTTRSEAIQQLNKTGRFASEVVQFRKDGSEVHIEARTVILRDDQGEISGYASVNRDITERKQIEKALQAAHAELGIKVQERTAALSEANALLQALMDHMPDHIYFKDRQSRFIRNSRSQAKLLGLNDPAEAVGKTDFDFFSHAAKAYAEEQEVMRSGKSLVDYEEWVVWPDGREMWVSTTKVPLRSDEGQIIGIFGISHDVTERKRAEQAIHQLNSNLEKQAEKLQAANKELEAFSYSVSHDLRAPLRAIDGYTRILVEDYEANLDEEGKRICAVISAEARRMGQLIDDLLAFSRLGRKEMFHSRVDMKALAISVFEELVQDQDQTRIDFQVGKLATTKGDLSLLHQVWANLLSNAIKFTSRKDRALIVVRCKQNSDENIYSVHDNGAGFDMEYANKLFGVFQRLHGESEFEGTGVGLAIVQRIVRRHGGRVWAEGEIERGATFYFALPRKENHHE